MEPKQEKSDQMKIADLLLDFKSMLVEILDNSLLFSRNKTTILFEQVWNSDISKQLKSYHKEFERHPYADEDLIVRGLFGEQLQLKSELFNLFRVKFKSIVDHIKNYLPHYISELLIDFLECIKNFLTSLGSFVPYSESIIEFIEALQTYFRLYRYESQRE
jgi:hypothetical protein